MTSQFGNFERSSFQFHLTGSRAFGNATQQSDWDFFCKNSQEAQEFLYMLNFRHDDASSYETTSLVVKKGDIHVQLVDDFDKKLSAQNHILGSSFLHQLHNKLSKKDRKLLWLYVLSLY